MTLSNGIPEKKTKGRRKIEIQKIDKKTSLQVSFSTRLLCGTDVAILIQPPSNKFFTFGEPSVESILNRLQFLDDDHNLVVEDRGKSKREFWWVNENLENMDLRELGAFEKILTGLSDKVLNRASHNPVVEEMGKNEETEGIISGAEEGGGPRNDEGFTRSVECFDTSLGSVVSRIGIRGVDVAIGDGVRTVAKVDDKILGGRDEVPTVADE
ncbi:agamous-like MADS-box AGL62 [Olea europaea subsp. europaea]|uniref:Agamous-like MADS-box AGL62 n=1 Tax=Olea europaea subsp. europaea TaxID=158383 RepID=A0A8S0PYY9_OLEEU|nr:agamous-like MADS-box AGL62 [Olea europaea subsp. europaea]